MLKLRLVAVKISVHSWSVSPVLRPTNTDTVVVVFATFFWFVSVWRSKVCKVLLLRMFARQDGIEQ